MATSRPFHFPSPHVQAFVICREIWHTSRSGECVLVGPINHVTLPAFPANVRLSCYIHLTGGHGRYPLDFLLRDPGGGTVWSWRTPTPLEHPDPLVLHQLTFHDLLIDVPMAGRYEMAVLADGQEIARQPVLFQ